MGMIIESNRASSACSGTCDWMNKVERSGSMPAAIQSARLSVRVTRELRGIGIFAGERMPIGHEVEAVVLVLQADPVTQRAHQVAEVELAGRAHPRHDVRTFGGHSSHDIRTKNNGPIRDQSVPVSISA